MDIKAVYQILNAAQTFARTRAEHYLMKYNFTYNQKYHYPCFSRWTTLTVESIVFNALDDSWLTELAFFPYNFPHSDQFLSLHKPCSFRSSRVIVITNGQTKLAECGRLPFLCSKMHLNTEAMSYPTCII